MDIDPHGHEPLDDDMLSLIQQRWAEQDAKAAADERRVVEAARRAEQPQRRGVCASIALASLPIGRLDKRSWGHRVRM